MSPNADNRETTAEGSPHDLGPDPVEASWDNPSPGTDASVLVVRAWRSEGGGSGLRARVTSTQSAHDRSQVTVTSTADPDELQQLMTGWLAQFLSQSEHPKITGTMSS